MSPQSRRALAGEYARVMIMAAEARRRGIDQSPEVQTLLKFSSLQILATRLVKEINAAAPTVSSEEVEKHYRDHARDYQQVSLSRIYVSARPKDAGHEVVPAAVRAERFRARAMNGEDFSALQSETAGSSVGATGQSVSMGPMQCLSLPDAHRDVCNLNPGEISNVLADGLGYTIYRLESRRALKLAEVRDGIRNMLERQRLEEEIEKVRGFVSLDLDENYFGKLPKPDVGSAHGMHFPASSKTAPATDMHKHQH